MAGRPLPLAVLMMIPEAWSGHESMDEERRAFYEYHGCLMEPWDGPASIAFTDGTVIGAVLDRNGLRPSRYYVTKDGMVVMASEVGVLDIPAERVLIKERLHPGRIFLVDTAQGRIIDDAELKRTYAAQHPYGEWLKAYLKPVESLPDPPSVPEPDHETVLERQLAFGYTHEDLRIILGPMAVNGEEPVGLHGHGHLARRALEPAAAPLRLLQAALRPGDEPAARRHPRGAGDADRHDDRARGQSARADARRVPAAQAEDADPAQRGAGAHPARGPAGLQGDHRLRCCSRRPRAPSGSRAPWPSCARRRARPSRRATAISSCPTAGSTPMHAPIPALLATSGVHHHLIREGTRVRVGLIIETGERARGAPHGPAPRLRRRRDQSVPRLRDARRHDRRGPAARASITATAVKNYIKALNKGILKVISKMGISTIQSYRGAQIFEAIGLDKEFVDRYFTWTASRMGGVGIEVVARGDAAPASARVPRAAGGRRPSSSGAASTSGAATASTTCSTPRPCSSCSTPSRSDQYGVFKEYTRRSTTRARTVHAARALRVQVGAARRCRSRRWSRSRRSSSASPPARCPTARSARRRTRRSPSR